MEEISSSRRRLESLSRHLLPPRQPDPILRPVVLNGERVREAVIIGGMVLDIHATPSIPANPRTTTPGQVHYVLGGVARNVAECMSKLGTKPFLISVVGLDVAGNKLMEHWKSAGLSIEGIQKRQDVGTPIICNIFDINGELASAVASVEAIEKFLRPEWIQQFSRNICYAPVLMVDANLNPVALEASCQMAAEFDIPVWFEPVSVAKSKRISSVVKYITIASPNEDELVAMANTLANKEMFQLTSYYKTCSIESLFLMLKPAICILLKKGIKIVLVTLGSNGVFLCFKGKPSLLKLRINITECYGFGRQLYETVKSSCPSKHFISGKDFKGADLYAVHFPALPASVVRLTGAGDCLVGGTLASLCAGLDIFQSVAVGVAAAKAAVESPTNVTDEYSLSSIADDAKSVYSTAKLCTESIF